MPNRLADATSPYLLQHQDNPVDWHEWGDTAFAEARERDVPVLLSVGYSACHWCHVMAHESFEDPETAAVMNRLYVNIKVDREERPDVDSIYMEAVQTMTGRGGWPMTVWLTPDGRPFYAGTYFPDEDRHGMPAFRSVMRAVSDAWDTKREEVLGQSDRLLDAISRNIPAAEGVPDAGTLQTAYASLASSFDPINGGFGSAPKFPQQPVLEFLLRAHAEDWAPRAAHMVKVTLAEMADGGIHDQLAGGFARYSVDDQWLVPHFEKMLYDNAQLARLYLWAGIELDEPRFVEVARATLGYLVTDLHDPEGGFHSAEDADSEGVEGKFYVWTTEELEDVLGSADAVRAAAFFGATPHGNFEGSNILYRPTSEDWTDEIESIRIRLRAHRAKRVRPGLDDKVIASWNGLAIRAFAEAGAALGDESYLDIARTTSRFVLDRMVVDGKLRRSWRKGRVGVAGFLEDHAAIGLGLFALYAATGEIDWYLAARDLTLGIPQQFADPDGGFFDTALDGESLIKRPKSQADNPLPSGNGMAAEALMILSAYTGEAGHRELAESAIRSAGLLMERYPSMVGHHLAVLHSSLDSKELAVVGPDWKELSRVYWERFRPEVVIAVSDDGSDPVPLLTGRDGSGTTQAYLCRGHVCELPTPDREKLRDQLDSGL
ncbi:MAG TPA: thioredoxin domain-containing protein [Acidimicrobiia bacterium]|nr:thioredoxin domain-containing protein [Acidimicrobiia bacterium]